MNTNAAKSAVKTLIDSNSATLLDSLSKQGADRVIAELTYSSLTPVPGYYFVAVLCPRAREYSDPNRAKTTARPSRWAEYEITILVSDESMIQPSEDAPYEKLHADIEKFTDRIIDLLETQLCIGNCLEFKRSPSENDRVFIKQDLSGTAFDTAENSWASLFFQIDFAIVDKCPDASALYS